MSRKDELLKLAQLFHSHSLGQPLQPLWPRKIFRESESLAKFLLFAETPFARFLQNPNAVTYTKSADQGALRSESTVAPERSFNL